MDKEITVTEAQYKSLPYDLKICGIKFLICDNDYGVQDYSSMLDLENAIRKNILASVR